MRMISGISQHLAPLRRAASGLLAGLCLVASCAGAWAAEAPEPQAAAAPGLSLPSQIDLPNLISVVGEFSGVSVHFSPQKVNGTARLDVRQELTADAAWALLNQVLLQHGFTTVVAGEPAVYHVVPVAEAEAVGSVFTDAQAAAAVVPPPGFITVVQDLHHIGAEVVIQAVAPALGPRAQAKAIGRDVNRLILSGDRERVLAVIRLATTLDRPGNEIAFRIYQPRYASGGKLQRSLTSAWTSAAKAAGRASPLDCQIMPDGQRLLIIGTTDEIPAAMTLLSDLDRSEPTITRSYRPDQIGGAEFSRLVEELIGAADDQRMRVVSDRLSGGIIITASETQHASIQALLKDLSNIPAGSRASVRSFAIKHRQAGEMAAVLRELTGNGAAAAAAPVPAAAPAADAAAARPGNVTGSGSGDLTFTVDSHTNTLVAMGPPRMVEQVEQLVAQLDQRQPQVQIETTLVILNQGETEALGVEWGGRVTREGHTLTMAQLFGLSKEGTSVVDRTATGTGLTSLIVKPGDYFGLLQALQTVNKGRSMVTTMTVVDNNSEASVTAVLQQPVSNINSGDNVATTTFGGTSDAGTEIKVKPLINAADQVQLTFSVSQSSFVGESTTTENGGVLPPPKRQDTISSVTTIPDGHIIALGGLTNDIDSGAMSGLPFLAKVPLLGMAFSNRTSTKSTSRFFLFIRADVLRHPLYEDLRHRSKATVKEAEMPAADGPELKPRFLD